MTRRDFASGFLKWNEDLSLRKLQWVVWNHIYGLHKTDISIFLKICSVLQQYAFKLHQIYNSIETGLTWVYKPICKVCLARVYEDCAYNDLCFFLWRLIFCLHFCYYFENDLSVRKSSKNLLKSSNDFAWFLNLKLIFKIITIDKEKT